MLAGWLLTMAILSVMAIVSGATSPTAAAAQDALDDAAAREYFERGRTAFDRADYENALIYFRHAYRLSRRGELQYNIGVAADRLQREKEALEAFEHYLEETEAPTREAEAKRRIEALRTSIEEREERERALQEAAVRYKQAAEDLAVHDGARIERSAIIGSSVLAAAGAAGVTAMSIGLARDGSCAQEVAGRCVNEHAATAWTWVYGGMGAAALVGSAVWLSVSAKRTKKGRTTQVAVSPTGLLVRGAF